MNNGHSITIWTRKCVFKSIFHGCNSPFSLESIIYDSVVPNKNMKQCSHDFFRGLFILLYILQYIFCIVYNHNKHFILMNESPCILVKGFHDARVLFRTTSSIVSYFVYKRSDVHTYKTEKPIR